MHYDYVFVTHLPAFYKVNLYNELSKQKNILIIFIAEQSICRTSDFLGHEISFDYHVLNTGNFEQRNAWISLFKIFLLIKKLKFDHIVIGGWDLLEFWLTTFTNRKSKNCLVLESTIIESKYTGISGFIKRLFLSRISIAFASGGLHKSLLQALNFSGEIRVTKGVGLIKKPIINSGYKKTYQKKFLYLGRLSLEKNLDMVIQIFNRLDDCYLSIVGDGVLKESLLQLANQNITFLGHIPNEKLTDLFTQFDFLILPSLSETWGLVIEEALYNRVPVIVSSHCGAAELIVHGENGLIFDPTNMSEFSQMITAINNDMYLKLLNGLMQFDIEKKDKHQLNTYL